LEQAAKKAAMNNVDSWNCSTCSTGVATNFCPRCGESRIKSSDLTLGPLLAQAGRSLTSLDGPLLRTLRNLVAHPGSLTTAYLYGPRKPFIAPFQLFLIANVIFFAVQSWADIKIFSTPLASHLNGQDWSELAQRLVAARLSVKGVTLAAFAPVFDQAAAVNAKSLVILMTIPFALLLISLFARSGRPFVTHMVFALHFYAFELLVLCALLLITIADTWLGGPNPRSAIVDDVLFGVQLVAAAVYLYFATARVYAASGASRIVKVAALVLAVGASVLAYRFSVFLITLSLA